VPVSAEIVTVASKLVMGPHAIAAPAREKPTCVGLQRYRCGPLQAPKIDQNGHDEAGGCAIYGGVRHRGVARGRPAMLLAGIDGLRFANPSYVFFARVMDYPPLPSPSRLGVRIDAPVPAASRPIFGSFLENIFPYGV
jgi:hypothetical protein